MDSGRIYVNIDGEDFDITEEFKNLVDGIKMHKERDPYFFDKEKDIPFCDHDCDECLMCDELEDYYDEDECEDYDVPCWGIPDIRRVVFSDPATIIFWEDNTKTVVKAMKGEKFERYAGFIAACAKKMFGSTSRAKAIMNECAEEQVKVEKKKKADKYYPDLTQAYNEVVANHESIKEAIDESLAR